MTFDEALKEAFDFDYLMQRLLGRTSEGPIPITECATELTEYTGVDSLEHSLNRSERKQYEL
jgi:hypothetical protein